MDCSTPGFPVHHRFPELAQTHIHRVVGIVKHQVVLKLFSIVHSITCTLKKKQKQTKKIPVN